MSGRSYPRVLGGPLRPGLCGQVSEGSEPTQGGFCVALVTGVWPPPPEALGASCHKRDSGPGDSGPRFPSRGLVLGDQVGSAFLPSPSTRPAPAPCPALCPLTGGPGPGCSDQLQEGHPPPRPDPGLSPRKPILSGRGLPGAGGRVLVGGTASTPRAGPAFFPGHPGSPPLTPGTASGQPSVGSVGCFRTAGPASVREPQENPDPAPRVQTCLRRLLACGRKLLVPGGAVVWDVSGPFLSQGTVAAYTLTRKFQDLGDGPDTEGPPGPPGCRDTCTRSAGGWPPRRWGGGLLHPPAPRRQCTSDSCPGGDPGPAARLRSGPEPRARGTLRDPRGAFPLRRPGPGGQSRPEGSGEASSSLR